MEQKEFSCIQNIPLSDFRWLNSADTVGSN